ncbi:hypothetical protein J3Q64DRAFT_1756406 [Phycomyces blakesleeanus]|uniref:Uncharacterized protein n=1 Tax=Phycomyces blakesleeanus TaxID=4837 RepID=A0ABR3ASW5_PHYBL
MTTLNIYTLYVYFKMFKILVVLETMIYSKQQTKQPTNQPRLGLLSIILTLLALTNLQTNRTILQSPSFPAIPIELSQPGYHCVVCVIIIKRTHVYTSNFVFVFVFF